MSPVSLDDTLDTLRNTLEDHLDKVIPATSAPYQSLFEAARYSLMSGGKRLRPLLTLLTTSTLGGSLEAALTPACAIEMIHTYSLIHDDLPCMDNDDFRRGKPTLHKVYPEGHAVLTADFLLTYAFELLAEAPHLSARQKIDLIKTLSKHSGGHGMIAGQVMDIATEHHPISAAHLQLIHEKKTAALIAASIDCGAIISNVPLKERQALYSFGQALGLAFQIMDDVLDVTHGIEKHGKFLGSDVANQKTTYVGLFGIDTSKQKGREMLETGFSYLQDLPYRWETFIEFSRRCVHVD